MTQTSNPIPSPTERWLTPEFFADPYPYFEELRSLESVHWSYKLNGWIVLDYSDVDTILRNPHLFSSAGRQAALLDALPTSERERFKAVYEHFSVGLIRSDPPDHTRLRRLISSVFTPRAIESKRARVESLVRDFLNAADSRSEMNVINDFAYLLPATVICEILGVPAGDRDRVRRWSEEINGVVAGVLPMRQAAEIAQKTLSELRSYYIELIEQRRRQPQDDLLSLLVHAEEQGDRLTMPELLSTAENLLAAGHETTTSLISSGLLTLLRHPDSLQRMRGDRSLLAGAIEEILRFESPIQRQTRVVAEDTEFRGKAMRRGQLVFVMIGAANRDPRVFPHAHEFDITRTSKHLAFGIGVHFCIGAPLARLQASIAFNSILDRFPRLKLQTMNVQWKPTASLRTVQEFRIQLQ